MNRPTASGFPREEMPACHSNQRLLRRHGRKGSLQQARRDSGGRRRISYAGLSESNLCVRHQDGNELALGVQAATAEN
jgi:hypothetical protein